MTGFSFSVTSDLTQRKQGNYKYINVLGSSRNQGNKQLQLDEQHVRTLFGNMS